MHPPKFLRGPLDWYYARIYVKVRPERVFVWPGGDAAVAPEILDSHIEEVRSGHVEEPPEPHADATGGNVAWDSRITELGTRYETGVLSWVGPDGFPIAVRVPIHLDPNAHRIRLDADPRRPAADRGPRLPDGPLPRRGLHLAGELPGPRRPRRARGGDWALVPRKLVGGFELPKGLRRYEAFIKNQWRFYRTAKKRTPG